MAFTRKIGRGVALALLLTLSLAAEITPREERDIARWIIRLGGSGNVTKTHVLWHEKKVPARKASYVPSPAAWGPPPRAA